MFRCRGITCGPFAGARRGLLCSARSASPSRSHIASSPAAAITSSQSAVARTCPHPSYVVPGSAGTSPGASRTCGRSATSRTWRCGPALSGELAELLRRARPGTAAWPDRLQLRRGVEHRRRSGPCQGRHQPTTRDRRRVGLDGPERQGRATLASCPVRPLFEEDPGQPAGAAAGELGAVRAKCPLAVGPGPICFRSGPHILMRAYRLAAAGVPGRPSRKALAPRPEARGRWI